MSQLTNYLETQIANYHKGTNMPAAPTVRLGLWQTSPGEDFAGGTEQSATISARQTVTFGAIATNGSVREIKNSADIDFGTAAGACTVDAFGVADAASAGNGLIYGTTTSKSINVADPVKVLANQLVVQIGGTAGTWLRDEILNWIKGTTATAAPASLYVALYDGDPDAAGTDVTTTIRAAGRVAITFGTVTDGVFSNSAAVDFGTADAAADVSHFRVYSASTAGNVWHTAALTTARNINAGDPVSFAIGDLAVTIA